MHVAHVCGGPRSRPMLSVFSSALDTFIFEAESLLEPEAHWLVSELQRASRLGLKRLFSIWLVLVLLSMWVLSIYLVTAPHAAVVSSLLTGPFP